MLKVVVVEDEELVRKGIVLTVDWAGAGCAVVGEAANGEEGLEVIRRYRPDLIVTDIRMPKLDGIDGATNYANCGGASWAVSSNCKNTELAFDFLKSTFGSSVELYDDLLPNAGAISSYLPAAESDVYNQPSEFYGGQTVYKDIVEFAGKVPAFDCGAYYSDVRSALTDAVTNIVQNNADIDSEMQNAQDTVEFNIAG
jgi:lactose/L-arabinose transport system substrate-binding protein